MLLVLHKVSLNDSVNKSEQIILINKCKSLIEKKLFKIFSLSFGGHFVILKGKLGRFEQRQVAYTFILKKP